MRTKELQSLLQCIEDVLSGSACCHDADAAACGSAELGPDSNAGIVSALDSARSLRRVPYHGVCGDNTCLIADSSVKSQALCRTLVRAAAEYGLPFSDDSLEGILAKGGG